MVDLPGIRLRTGMARRALGFDGIVPDDVDGVAFVSSAPTAAPDPPTHPNGITAVDHVVLVSPDGDRTAAALSAAGLELRRTRETPLGGTPGRQRFFRAGPAIIELVSPAVPAPGPASVWGVAFVAPDLDRTARWFGPERCSAPRDAVQPGRRIASLRRAAVGIGPSLAVMSPR